jgi:hypothetical protein
MVVDGVAPSDTVSSLRSADVSYGFLPSGADEIYFDCGVQHDGANNADMIEAAAMRNDSPDDDQTAALPTGFQGVRIRLVGTARRVGSTQPRAGTANLSCTAGSQPGVSNAVKFFPDGQFGLRTFGMTAWFDYIFYVEMVPAP